MIVRVDEFPWMIGGVRAHPQPWDLLRRFLDALRAPCCLAVVFPGEGLEGVKDDEIERLQNLPDVTLAMHGVGHRRLEHESAGRLAGLRKQLGQEPGIAIPPCNRLTPGTIAALVAAGYALVCTGPETYRDCPDLKIEGIREVPSAWYGKLRDHAVEGERFGRLDCVTLHLGWERDFTLVKKFGEQYRDRIVSWTEVLKDAEA